MHRLALVFCGVILLSVQFSKGQEDVVSQNFYSIEGRAAYLPCSVNNEDASWDYDPARFGRRARVNDNKELIINNVLPQDAGEYTCTSSLGSGSVELVVMDTSAPRDVALNPVTSSMLRVTWEIPLGSSEAIKSYNILINNPNDESESPQRLLVREFSNSGRQSYLIQNLTPGQVYQIRIFGRYGFGLNGENFHVPGPSTTELIEMPGGITQKMTPVEPPQTASTLYAILESAAILTCDRIENDKDGMWEYEAPEDERRYSIRYRPDRKQLVLTIPRPEMEDAGDFTCVSSGGRSTVRLVVIDRRAPQFLRAEAISQTEVKLSWTAPQGPTEYITKYVVTFNTPEEWNRRESIEVTELADDGMETFTLENLAPGETYQIRVVARYLYGLDDERSFDVSGPGSNIAEVTLPSDAQPTKASPENERPRTAGVMYSIIGRSALLRCFGVSREAGMWEYDESRFQERATIRYDLRSRVLFLSINTVRPEDAGKYDCVSGSERSTVELIVLEPSPPQRLGVRVLRSRRNIAQVYWTAPATSAEHVKFYNLKVLAVGISREPTEYQVNVSTSSSWTSQILQDLIPGTTYDVEVQAIYFFGENAGGPDTKGPPALTRFQVPGLTQRPTVAPTQAPTQEPTTIEQSTEETTESEMKTTTEPQAETTEEPTPTPRPITERDVMPLNVRATPVGSGAIRVTWVLNMSIQPDLLIAYRVQLKGGRIQQTADARRASSVSYEDDTSNWEVEFTNLQSNEWYYINVRPYLRTGFPPATRPVSVYLRSAEMGPLSVNAVAMSCSHALVSYRSVTRDRLSDVSVSMMEENRSGWEPVRSGSHDKSKQYILVADLRPSTTYFFKVEARLGSKTVEVVTHVSTQSSDSSRPTDVTAVGYGSSRIRVNWDKPAASETPLFYKISTEERQQDNTFKPVDCRQTEVVLGYSNEAVVSRVSLDGDNQYRVSVTPYDLSGPGLISEMVVIPGDAEDKDNATGPADDDTRLQVVVLMVMEDMATLTMNVTGHKAQRVQTYRVRVNHVTPHGPHHKEQILEINKEDVPLTIENLKPHRTYEVIVHAIARGMRRPMLSEKVFIRTSDTCSTESQNKTTEMPSDTSMSSDVTESSDASMSPEPSNSTDSSMSSDMSSDGTMMSAIPTNATDVSEEPRQPLQFTTELPDELLVRPEDKVDLNCTVTGSPMPDIRFYKDGQLAAAADAGTDSVNFNEENITSSYTLQCIAYNDQEMIMKEVKVVLQEPENVSVDAYVVRIGETEVSLRWMITSGDVDSVSIFVVILLDDVNDRVGTAFRGKDARSFTLSHLQANSRYSVVLKTIASGKGLVDEDTVEISPEKLSPKPDDPVSTLHLDVTEIRDTAARLGVRATGPIAGNVKQFAITFNKIGEPKGATLLIEPQDGSDEGFYNMPLLEPESEYEVNVRADSSDPMIDSVESMTVFNTSTPGVSGPPVLSQLTASEMGVEDPSDSMCPPVPTCPVPVDETSAADAQNGTTDMTQDDQSMATPTSDVSQDTTDETSTDESTEQATSDDSETTEQPTVTDSETTDLSTEDNDETTEQPTVDNSDNTEEPTATDSESTGQSTDDNNETTEQPTVDNSDTTEQPTVDNSDTTEEQGSTALTESETTMEMTTEIPKNYSHTLALRALNTHTGLHLMWFVEKGDLSLVKGFNLQVLLENGAAKLNTNLSSTIRSLNVQKTEGFEMLTIQLTALDASGEDIGQAKLKVNTTEFSTEPELIVEVNEIRATSVRILWYVKGVESNQLEYFRMIIRKGKSTNRPMLDRKIPPKSRSTRLKRLRPNTAFFMTVEAMGKAQSLFLTVDLNFTNPSDVDGTPVIVSSAGDMTTVEPTQEPSTPMDMSSSETDSPSTNMSTPDGKAMSTDNTEVSDEATETMTTEAAEATTSEQCSPYLKLTITKDHGKLILVEWMMKATDEQAVKQYQLTVYEIDTWDRTVFNKQNFDLSAFRSADVLLGDTRTDYYFVLEALAEDGSVVTKAEKDYFLEAMKDKETAHSACFQS